MQLFRARGMNRIENNTFSERKEKENLSLSFALWKSCFYLCILKLPSNQLHMKKKHLTEGQRYEISAYLQSGKSQKDIAKILGFNKSTVSRELRRNSDGRNGKYSPNLAQRKYGNRMANRFHYYKFTESLKLQVDILLKADNSPEQIEGFLKRAGMEHVSHETIYLYVWQDKKRGDKELYKHLRRKGRHYAKRGSKTNGRGFIKNRIDIDQRPEIVDEKVRFGDFEIDTVIGKNHKGALLTINDRATGIVLIRKLSGKEAAPLTEATIKALSPIKHLIHTITADNGKEFSFHEKIAAELNIFIYFAKPYHSWERGANENTNGLIRQYFPKGTDFGDITPEQVMRVQNILNARPRKRLGYMTPKEKFKQLTNWDYNEVALSD
jgi:transposase, IS30 family